LPVPFSFASLQGRSERAEDQLQNLRAVREGTRVFSAYELRDGTRIWIITEADRSVTTILLPDGVLALEAFEAYN
jgi:hypothetical protein